jgi:hypothetical protein
VAEAVDALRCAHLGVGLPDLDELAHAAATANPAAGAAATPAAAVAAKVSHMDAYGEEYDSDEDEDEDDDDGGTHFAMGSFPSLLLGYPGQSHGTGASRPGAAPTTLATAIATLKSGGVTLGMGGSVTTHKSASHSYGSKGTGYAGGLQDATLLKAAEIVKLALQTVSNFMSFAVRD